MSTFGVSGKPSYRSANALGFLLSAGSLAATAIYLAPIADLENCTLCSVIRLMLVVTKTFRRIENTYNTLRISKYC